MPASCHKKEENGLIWPWRQFIKSDPAMDGERSWPSG